MIDGMLVAGFKAFSYHWDYLRIRPITLIFGANGSGKSSLLQSIAWLHHIHVGGNPDTHRMELTGHHVNLGGFTRFSNRTATDALYASIQVEYGIGMGWGFQFDAPVRSPQVNPERHPFYGLQTPNWCLTYEIDASGVGLVRIFCGQLALVWEREESVFVHKGFWSEIEDFGDPTEENQRFAPEDLRGCLTTMFGIEQIGATFTDDYCHEFSAWVRTRLLASNFTLRGIAPSLDLAPHPNHQAPEYAEQFLKNLEVAVAHMNQDIRAFIEGLDYLGPWRQIPTAEDLLAAKSKSPSPDITLWDRLRTDPRLLADLNAWLKKLGSRLEVANRDLVGREAVQEALLDIIRSTAIIDSNGEEAPADPTTAEISLSQALKAVLQVPSSEQGVILRLAPSKEEIAPGDTGVGISQVVPILIAGLSGAPRHWIIEQPELHLHPKAQAHLGDLLIHGSQSSRGPHHCFIVETHSEHLILRLLRRVRETYQQFDGNEFPVHPENLTIAYIGVAPTEPVNEGAKHFFHSLENQNFPVMELTSSDEDYAAKLKIQPSRITNIQVTRDGDFSMKWPDGFFEERLDEIFSAEEHKSWFGE